MRNVMKTDMLVLHDRYQAQEAAQAFERYDLVTAPVTDRRGRLVGRVTLDAVLDFTRQRAAERSRRTWLAVNLVTACVASRVISVFEGTIEKWSRSPR